MKSYCKRLGDYIRPVDNRNIDLKVTLLRGVSTSKKLIESVANLSGVEFSGYKVVKKGQFVYVSDTSRRGDKIAIAMCEEDECIVSSIYTVFEVVSSSKLLPEYLLMWFKRKEFDRYTRFHSWGSARETFTWDDLCDIRLPLPDDVEKQRLYASIYIGLMKNQQLYENSFDDLQLICDSYMEALAIKEGSKVLGDYLQPVDNRNTDMKITHLRGVSTSKQLIKSVANKNGLDFSTYKIVETGQFVYVADTSRRGDKIALAINEQEPCIVSSIYTVFEIKKQSGLMSEFLFLWFKRKEFDRYARFHSWGSARETFDWSDMCAVRLPIPDIEVQKAIVAIHFTLETRKRINERLKSLDTPLCPVLIKGVIDNINKKSIENGHSIKAAN